LRYHLVVLFQRRFRKIELVRQLSIIKMQIITHRIHYFMLYRSLIACRRISLLEILFVFNRSLPSLFRFTLCRLITVLIRFHHHVFVGFNLVYLIFLKDLFLVIPICNVVGIIAVTHSVLMVSVLNH